MNNKNATIAAWEKLLPFEKELQQVFCHMSDTIAGLKHAQFAASVYGTPAKTPRHWGTIQKPNARKGGKKGHASKSIMGLFTSNPDEQYTDKQVYEILLESSNPVGDSTVGGLLPRFVKEGKLKRDNARPMKYSLVK